MMDPSLVAPMMGRLWSPIGAVSSRWQGKDNVQIAVAMAAASIVPTMPRVVVQVYKRNFSHDMIFRSKAFALNFLRPDQLDHIHDFGFVSGKDLDKLEGIAYHSGVSGSPILEDCWGYMDCRVVNAMDGGDMTCFLGEVLDGRTWSRSEPLWWPEARKLMPSQWNEEWDRKVADEIKYSTERMQEIIYSSWKP